MELATNSVLFLQDKKRSSASRKSAMPTHGLNSAPKTNPYDVEHLIVHLIPVYEPTWR